MLLLPGYFQSQPTKYHGGHSNYRLVTVLIRNSNLLTTLSSSSSSPPLTTTMSSTTSMMYDEFNNMTNQSVINTVNTTASTNDPTSKYLYSDILDHIKGLLFNLIQQPKFQITFLLLLVCLLLISLIVTIIFFTNKLRKHGRYHASATSK